MRRRLISEFAGSAFLLLIVVGSGIMGERLAGGNEGLALLANSLSTGLGLFVLIESLGPVSGAHFNPWVSVFYWSKGGLGMRELAGYFSAQMTGAFFGVLVGNAIFGGAFFQLSPKLRSGSGLLGSEAIATFGLLSVVHFSKPGNGSNGSFRVAAFVTSAYWFTSSTAFANGAVTIARMLTDSFCGIAPSGVPGFLAGQGLGALAACLCFGRFSSAFAKKV
jgi:glycerol uptake facilitator-like aquaporin